MSDDVIENHTPPHEDETCKAEHIKAQINNVIETAKKDVATAAMAAPDDPAVQYLNQKLLGANADNTDLNELPRIAERASEEAAKKIRETTTGSLLTLAGIGVLLSQSGMVFDGSYHPGQTCAGAPGMVPLMNNFASLPPKPEQQGQQLFI